MDNEIIKSNLNTHIEAAKLRYAIAQELIKSNILKDGLDYGTIPGSSKPTLLKAGAEKLISANLFTVGFEFIERIERWEPDNPLFYYLVKATIYDALGHRVADADGSCNSMESKYRFRWVEAHDIPAGMDTSGLKERSSEQIEFDFAIDKAETAGQYGKPASYWQAWQAAIADGSAVATTRKTRTGKDMKAWRMGRTVYRVPNDDIFDQVNTVLKMATKRALVAAVLIACNVSEFFTQDLEDMPSISFSDEIIVSKVPPVKTEPVTTNTPESRQEAENSDLSANGGVDTEAAQEGAKTWFDDIVPLVINFGYDNEHHARASIAKLANGKVEGYTLNPRHKPETNAVVVMYYCADKIHGWDKAQVNAVLGAAMNEGDNAAPLKKFSEWTAAGFGLEAAWNTLVMAKEMEAEVAPESGVTDDIPW